MFNTHVTSFSLSISDRIVGMDIVVLDGVKYVKASVAAKRFKYTSDYVGQLCRGKKVDARLVGRTWFVNPDSLEEHKQAKHGANTSENKPLSTSRKDEESTEVAINIKPEQVAVNAPLKNKTVKSTLDKKVRTPQSRIVSISYNDDSESLLPKVKSKTEFKLPVPEVDQKTKKFVRIETGPAKKLKIGSGSKKPTSFIADELPEVALSGKLAVSDYKNEKVDAKTKPVTDLVEKSTVKPVVEKPTVKAKGLTKKSAKPARAAHFTPAVVQQQSQSSSNSLVLFSPLIATVLATIIAVVVFSASSLVIVNSEETISKVALQLADVIDIFKR